MATYENIMDTIAQVAAAERITKAALSTLSRDILNYVVDEEDIRPVNALLGCNDDKTFVLTPINWRIAVQYFHYFIGFTSNYDDVKAYAIDGVGKREPLVFGKKAKKKWDKSVELINEWLEDPANDLWVWSNNTKMDSAPKDWRAELQKVVLNAMGEGKAKQQGEMSLSDIMGAITELEQVGVHDLMAALQGAVVPELEEAA